MLAYRFIAGESTLNKMSFQLRVYGRNIAMIFCKFSTYIGTLLYNVVFYFEIIIIYYEIIDIFF